MMKMNKWTLGLAAVGLITIPATMQAEEKMSAVQTLLASTTLSGYVDTSVQWGWGRSIERGYDENVYRPPSYAFNTPSKQDGFNLNVVNLVIEKGLDPQDNWAAGYKVDMIFGPNATGWNSSYDAIVRNYDQVENNFDFALKQAYVALRAPVGNGIDFKMGSFDAIIGYETFHAGNNPNYTRSWGYTFEPTQHTGLLASYQFCKEFGIAAGIANTWNAGINNRAWLYAYGEDDTDVLTDGNYTSGKSPTSKTFMAAATLTAPDSMGGLAGSTLYAGIVSGFNNALGGTASYGEGAQLMSIYSGVTLNTGVKGLKVGAAYDYVSAGNDAGQDTIPGFWFNAAAAYVSYQLTEKLSIHGRGEYVWSNLDGNDGMASSMISVTGTLQYDLWANTLTRLEFRWDRDVDGDDNGKPFNYNDENAFLLALNVIYKF